MDIYHTKMRKYEQTHPWLTFSLDLSDASHRIWLALGEAASKCEHIAGAPLLPAVWEHLHRIYLTKGVLGTTAIEGNTLTEEEARERIEGRLKLPPSKEYLGIEIDNIVRAVNLIGERILAGERGDLTVGLIQEYNRITLEGLELAQGISPGEIRAYPVVVRGTGYEGAPAEDCEFLLQKLCDWLNEPISADAGDAIVSGLLKAVLAHIYIAWIHPFGDGNGRIARLVEFQILVNAGVPSPAAHLLSNHYNQTRQEYYRQLAATSRSGGKVLPFIEYALRGFIEGLKEQLQVIRTQQLAIAWRDYINWFFHDRQSTGEKRRHNLILEISRAATPVTLIEMPELSPQVARAYANVTQKTLSRDVNWLLEMDLLERSGEGYRAKLEKVLVFLPARRSE